jgi:hypothetical protein
VEAVILFSFILMRQNRMMHRGERRDHLNLQVDLLAEKEITKVLQMVRAICERMGLQNVMADKAIGELSENTSIESLSRRLEDRLPETQFETVRAGLRSRRQAEIVPRRIGGCALRKAHRSKQELRRFPCQAWRCILTIATISFVADPAKRRLNRQDRMRTARRSPSPAAPESHVRRPRSPRTQPQRR